VVPDVEPTDNFAPPRRSQENRDRLDELASQGKYQEALGLLRAMQEGETPPTPVQYHKVVLACKAGRQWALALDLVREMQQKGLQVMLHTFGAVMDVCASAGKLDSALLVAQWMEEAGLELNRVIFTTLIKACGEAGEAPRALEVLARMRGSGLSLDYFGVLKVVELLGSAGLLEEAMQEIALIEADDTVVADYRVYFSVIRNALIHGRGDVAIRAFEMMRDMECTPPPSALKVLWDTLGRVGAASPGSIMSWARGSPRTPLCARQGPTPPHSNPPHSLLSQLTNAPTGSSTCAPDRSHPGVGPVVGAGPVRPHARSGVAAHGAGGLPQPAAAAAAGRRPAGRRA
jgi:pentatricopeptide repeat protein